MNPTCFQPMRYWDNHHLHFTVFTEGRCSISGLVWSGTISILHKPHQTDQYPVVLLWLKTWLICTQANVTHLRVIKSYYYYKYIPVFTVCWSLIKKWFLIKDDHWTFACFSHKRGQLQYLVMKWVLVVFLSQHLSKIIHQLNTSNNLPRVTYY